MRFNGDPMTNKKMAEEHIRIDKLDDDKFTKKLQDAKSYLGQAYAIGSIDASVFEGKTDAELIDMANEMMVKADLLT